MVILICRYFYDDDDDDYDDDADAVDSCGVDDPFLPMRSDV